MARKTKPKRKPRKPKAPPAPPPIPPRFNASTVIGDASRIVVSDQLGRLWVVTPGDALMRRIVTFTPTT